MPASLEKEKDPLQRNAQAFEDCMNEYLNEVQKALGGEQEEGEAYSSFSEQWCKDDLLKEAAVHTAVDKIIALTDTFYRTSPEIRFDDAYVQGCFSIACSIGLS